jgi:hypothetical protein
MWFASSEYTSYFHWTYESATNSVNFLVECQNLDHISGKMVQRMNWYQFLLRAIQALSKPKCTHLFIFLECLMYFVQSIENTKLRNNQIVAARLWDKLKDLDTKIPFKLQYWWHTYKCKSSTKCRLPWKLSEKEKELIFHPTWRDPGVEWTWYTTRHKVKSRNSRA